MSKLISVVGPTASGKTGLSVALAKHYDAEIVSVDSMQIYRGMDIGTAKVTTEEMSGIPHHMIDIFDPTMNCNVQKFVKLARNCVDNILARGKSCILAGGTGLYVDHLIADTKFVDIPANDSLRKELNSLSQEQLLAKLALADPASYERLHANDTKRIVRALEIVTLTGKTIGYWDELSHLDSDPLPVVMIGLDYSDREFLYDRINRRVDTMMAAGLENEVKRLLWIDGFDGSTASEGIGYKEMLSYLKGFLSLEDAVSMIKQNSRRYAKRQLTWFRRNSKINWIQIDEDTSFNQIVDKAIKIIERK